MLDELQLTCKALCIKNHNLQRQDEFTPTHILPKAGWLPPTRVTSETAFSDLSLFPRSYRSTLTPRGSRSLPAEGAAPFLSYVSSFCHGCSPGLWKRGVARDRSARRGWRDPRAAKVLRASLRSALSGSRRSAQVETPTSSPAPAAAPPPCNHRQFPAARKFSARPRAHPSTFQGSPARRAPSPFLLLIAPPAPVSSIQAEDYPAAPAQSGPFPTARAAFTPPREAGGEEPTPSFALDQKGEKRAFLTECPSPL